MSADQAALPPTLATLAAPAHAGRQTRVITTPPPFRDLALPGSDWSADWDDDAPAGVRRPPRVGEVVVGFKLVGELGRGAFARVYLAHQEALANRPVALKLTLRPTREAERLARLQHTNIVPVYSVHDDGPVQVICMPFLGRATIADLLRAYRADHSSRLHARKTSARFARTTLVDSKSGAGSDGRSGAPRGPAWPWDSDESPPIVGDPLAVLGVLAQLAAGLEHAHARGIMHLDLKPANVLLADDGTPMLLDFNLSFDASRPDRDMVGGTVPYMAVEQLLDMRTRGAGALDPRTDLYALGAMGFEMLTGGVPFPLAGRAARDIEAQVAARRAGPPPLRAGRPEISPAVEAIVRKLLAPDPAARYQSAADLRTDLERHLNDLPLRFAAEPSVRERFGKWRRRNPGVAVRLMASGLIGLALGLGGVVHQRAEANARADAVEHARAARAGLDGVRLDLVLPGDPEARRRGAERAEAVLAGYGLPGDTDWQQKPDVRRLPAAERAALASDMGEMLLLLAQVHARDLKALPEAERRAAATRAWKLNSAARGCFPADAVPPALAQQAARLAHEAGEEAPAAPEEVTGNGGRANFLAAAFALQSGRYATAVPLLDRVITAQPDHAAAQFCLAYCRQQLGQYARALERYDAARVLLPKDPRPAFQRGLIHGVCKKPALAEAEFTRAVELDPDHGEAYRNRGLMRYRMAKADEPVPSRADAARKLFEAAEKDYTLALERGASPLHVHLLRAAARDGRDPAGAKADREAAKALPVKTEMDYVTRASTRTRTDPEGALTDYRKAIEINPRSLIALQNQVHVLADRLNEKDLPAALTVADRLVELYPEFALARAGRAVVLARLGKRDEAQKEIERAQLLSDDAEVSFQAACVFALAAGKNPDDKAKALDLLRRAIRDGYSDPRGLDHADFDNVRTHPDFRGIRQAAETFLK
ncbi:MAG: protein kinase domain-containing protein [Gemmata sp.]